MSILRRIEQGFAILSLLFFTGAVTDLLNESSSPVAAGPRDPLTRSLSLIVQLGSFILIFLCHKKIFLLLIKDILFCLLIVIILASILWSAIPSNTLSASTMLLRITLFGVYLAARFSLKEQLRIFAWVFGIGAVLSLVFAVALPSYGVMGRGSIATLETMAHAGAWRGAYIHKNVLGRVMVLSTIVFFISISDSSCKKRWVRWAGFGLSILLILASTSKSSLVILVTILGLLPLYRALRWNYAIAIPFFITLILLAGGIATVIVSNAEAILISMGKDLTLTGRTPLWAAVLDKIWERPWLGYGLEGFWQGLDGESADILLLLGWEVPHSHNGFLDLTLELGLVGFVVFTLGFLSAYLQGVAWIRLTKTADGLWPLAYLTFLLMANLTESSLLRQKSLWLLYVAAIFTMHNRSLNFPKSDTLRQEKSHTKK